jgi:hypothetical protein
MPRHRRTTLRFPVRGGNANRKKLAVRLILTADWRALGFGVALTVLVAVGFGLAPALHASAVKPLSALKGGEDLLSRRSLMNSLIAGQRPSAY